MSPVAEDTAMNITRGNLYINRVYRKINFTLQHIRVHTHKVKENGQYQETGASDI